VEAELNGKKRGETKGRVALPLTSRNGPVG
jgi:hypothetical protein